MQRISKDLPRDYFSRNVFILETETEIEQVEESLKITFDIFKNNYEKSFFSYENVIKLYEKFTGNFGQNIALKQIPSNYFERLRFCDYCDYRIRKIHEGYLIIISNCDFYYSLLAYFVDEFKENFSTKLFNILDYHIIIDEFPNPADSYSKKTLRSFVNFKENLESISESFKENFESILFSHFKIFTDNVVSKYFTRSKEFFPKVVFHKDTSKSKNGEKNSYVVYVNFLEKTCDSLIAYAFSEKINLIDIECQFSPAIESKKKNVYNFSGIIYLDVPFVPKNLPLFLKNVSG